MSGKVIELREHDLAKVGKWDRDSKFAMSYSPRNIASGKFYQRLNKDILTAAAREKNKVDFASYWGTWKQWAELGCRPYRDETPVRIYFRNMYHCVWNLEQVRLPDNPPEVLSDAIQELLELEQARARDQGKLTRDEWQAYRWGLIRTANER